MSNAPGADERLLITGAHAHNDYEHHRPLFDALDNGFCSVEADIFLTNGQLLVAHTLADTRPARTLQSLYLEPLRTLVKENGGRVYSNGPEFTLLIELKQDWRGEYPALRDVLANYADMLVSYRTVVSQSPTGAWVTNEVRRSNAILAIITGHRDKEMFAGETVRYAALDGQMSDLDKNPPVTLVPWISENWKSYFYWNGLGAMPDEELRKLQSIVKRTHEQGRRLRFWNSPDNPNFWQAIHVAGVDLINTDNLPGVAKFFRAGNQKPPAAEHP
ncbi:MAG TPA: phosphatidylinositol-specific phospholipase C/glycerophosphodiester phosphodiesterase family protein [Verrucomicrobiae bacterium]|nr:phosphatidylinositol-specific phospholipase C/glycerophosphodiester phosphodiesterase family protein [Verrucomicrobiae bacterium]